MDHVGKSIPTFEYYKTSDTKFKAGVLEVRKLLAGGEKPTVPDFPKFARDYLGLQLFNHQLQWVDLIEGREPRNLHMSQRYERGWMTRKKLYVCNTPPDHAKTHTPSISYITWRILKNPNLRVLIISKTQDLAKDILSAVKDRLDSPTPMFEELKRDFSPPDGFDGNSSEWRQDRILHSVDVLTSGENDPTVRAAAKW